MQILVHFLLLTAPTPPESEQAPDVTDANKSPQSPSKKRKRNSTGDGEHLMSRETLEEQLEMLMDKLAMWQLMGSLDERGRGGGGTSAGISAKGKRKEADDRDWMQIFCEDVVEAQSVCFPFGLRATVSLTLTFILNPRPPQLPSHAARAVRPPPEQGVPELTVLRRLGWPGPRVSARLSER